jgi:hypothetical protein
MPRVKSLGIFFGTLSNSSLEGPPLPRPREPSHWT